MNGFPPSAIQRQRTGIGAAKPYYLTEQNEQGVIVYLSNKSLKNAQIDGYFIYKGDQPDRHELDQQRRQRGHLHRRFQDHRHAGEALVLFR